jgi:hypothetical protein
MRPVVFVLPLALTLPTPLAANENSIPAKDLHSLFDAEGERHLRASPGTATCNVRRWIAAHP